MRGCHEDNTCFRSLLHVVARVAVPACTSPALIVWPGEHGRDEPRTSPRGGGGLWKNNIGTGQENAKRKRLRATEKRRVPGVSRTDTPPTGMQSLDRGRLWGHETRVSVPTEGHLSYRIDSGDLGSQASHGKEVVA